MREFLWDQDLRAILSSLLASGRHDNEDVDEVMALAVRYARALEMLRTERAGDERGGRDRAR